MRIHSVFKNISGTSSSRNSINSGNVSTNTSHSSKNKNIDSESKLSFIKKIPLKLALKRTEALTFLEAGHLHASTATYSDIMPKITLDGAILGRFMTKMLDDVTHVSEKTGMDKNASAEKMRQTIIEGQFAKNTNPRNKALMLFALYAIREMEAAKRELQAVMTVHDVFKNVDGEKIWKMLIDGEMHEEGTHKGLRFENEPGYLAGMLRGLTQVLRNDLATKQGNSITPDSMLTELHDTATERVITRGCFNKLIEKFRENPDSKVHLGLVEIIGRETAPNFFLKRRTLSADEQENLHHDRVDYMKLGYRRCGVRFGLVKDDNLSRSGLKELQAYHKENKALPYVLKATDFPDHAVENLSSSQINEIYLHALEPELLPEELHPQPYAKRLYETYQQNIKPLTDEKQKLKEIVNLCQQLERGHGFRDGNARTFGVLLLNQLLLENNLSPCIMLDPNHFDGLSKDELVNQILKGQAKFKNELLVSQ